MDLNLEKCPHCGGSTELTFRIPVYGSGGCKIECISCHAMIQDYKYAEQHFDKDKMTLSTPVTTESIIKCIERAVDKWNRRVGK